jgi:catechol 2,3-dioxygenase-like lactoylglutathione lyase family enzyme
MVQSLARIEMTCGNARALADFYQFAFGFVELERTGGLTDGKHHSIRMHLGGQEITLIEARPLGRPYPANVAGWSPLFQHIAIVVSNMATAFEQLSTIPGWSSISTAGPQLLPPASGRVTAFKFRDPEGHPLELIAFAPDAIPAQWQVNSDGCCLGIDHSAISVANTAKSVAFYESLGLIRSSGSLNVGREQAQLDDLPNAVVEVTALSPAQSTPHVELLCYRGDFDRHAQQRTNDATATRLVFSVESRHTFDVICASHSGSLVTDSMEREADAPRVLLRDPDGHLICLETGA